MYDDDDDDDVCILKHEFICFVVNKHHNISYSHTIISYESLHIVIHSFIHIRAAYLSIALPSSAGCLLASSRVGRVQTSSCRRISNSSI